VYVVETKISPGEIRAGMKRTRGGSKAEWMIEYRKEETIKDIKLEVGYFLLFSLGVI
jgi:hypothetical protein